jgi:hypothetical protein
VDEAYSYKALAKNGKQIQTGYELGMKGLGRKRKTHL